MDESTSEQASKQFVRQVLDAGIKIAALLIVAIACYDILKPFITPVLWAAIIAVAVKPISDWVENRLKCKRKLAATLVTLALLGMLIVPTAILTSELGERLATFTEQLKSGDFALPKPSLTVREWPLVGEDLYGSWSAAADNLEAFLKSHEDTVRNTGIAIVKQLANLGLTVLIMVFSIIIAGVFLASADGAIRFARQFTVRLAGAPGERFAALAGVTIRNVTRGILGVAVLQALLAGVGFYVIGLPAAPLLAGIVLVMSIVQINPILLMVPLAIYVFSYASPVIASIYLLWSIVVGAMDNVLKPLIMGKGADVPMLVIFIGAVGGFVAMGFAGLFVGAVIMVVGYELFIAWLHPGEAKQPQEASGAV
jgi:predicted PurR-regulated permease PerM